MRSGTAKTTRLRKASCCCCGYTIRLSRQWIAVGLPACPNRECPGFGLDMACPDAADQVVADPALLESLTRPERTRICRENGWTDSIIRTSVSQEPRRRVAVAADLPF